MVSSRTMKHRKLFPASTTNQSIVCPDVCDSTCPYDCYPYSDTYAVPPPSPPPPLLPPLSTKHGQNISPYVIIIATLLGIAFLIICYYLVIVKNCAGWNRFRPRRRQHESTEDDFVDENRDPAIDHPIWYIRTVGLQPSVINSIAVFRHKKGDSLIEGTDCSICLNEFQDDEILRLLPKCNHAFHIPCIDTWLRSHTTCPVCRSGIVSNSVSTPVASNNLNYNSLSMLEIVHTDMRDTRNEDNQMQYTESTSDGGLSNNQARIDEVDENRTIADDEVEFPQVVIDVQGETSNMRVNFDEDAASWVIDYSDENNMVQDEIQQMRRSISADSLSVAKIRSAMVNLPTAEFEDSPVNRIGDAHKCDPAEHNTSKSKTSKINYDRANASLQPESVSMKRSSSYGSRSFFSRNSRSLNSILPL